MKHTHIDLRGGNGVFRLDGRMQLLDASWQLRLQRRNMLGTVADVSLSTHAHTPPPLLSLTTTILHALYGITCVSRHPQILLVQRFTACMPLLTATSAFGLGRRRWSSHQQCYLHCLHTLMTATSTFELDRVFLNSVTCTVSVAPALHKLFKVLKGTKWHSETLTAKKYFSVFYPNCFIANWMAKIPHKA